MLHEQVSSGLRLKTGKLKQTLRVPFDHGLDCCVAEIAKSIKKEDRRAA